MRCGPSSNAPSATCRRSRELTSGLSRKNDNAEGGRGRPEGAGAEGGRVYSAAKVERSKTVLIEVYLLPFVNAVPCPSVRATAEPSYG